MFEILLSFVIGNVLINIICIARDKLNVKKEKRLQ